MRVNHITVYDDFFNGALEVKAVLDTDKGLDLQRTTVERDDLRQHIEQHAPCVIWQDNQLMQLCSTIGCNELVPERSGCDKCGRCLAGMYAPDEPEYSRADWLDERVPA